MCLNKFQPGPMTAIMWRAILARQPLLFTVTSNSMRPTFFTGERVLIRPVLPGEPSPGQVAAYFRDGLVTHRYLGGQCFRGDAFQEPDPPVAAEDVVGIVTAVERQGRQVPVMERPPLKTRLYRLWKRLARWRR